MSLPCPPDGGCVPYPQPFSGGLLPHQSRPRATDGCAAEGAAAANGPAQPMAGAEGGAGLVVRDVVAADRDEVVGPLSAGVYVLRYKATGVEASHEGSARAETVNQFIPLTRVLHPLPLRRGAGTTSPLCSTGGSQTVRNGC